jgi:hypothetical protein
MHLDKDANVRREDIIILQRAKNKQDASRSVPNPHLCYERG